MSFEDRLRADLQRAGGTMPLGPTVELGATMVAAKRVLRVQVGAMIAATAVAIAGLLVGIEALRERDRAVVSPIETPSETPTPTPTPTLLRETCSAVTMSAELDQQSLPSAVSAMRTAIAQRAVTCDYDALERLALDGDEMFTYSFGENGAPAEYWARSERRGQDDPLRKMVQILNVDFCIEEVSDGSSYYFWPSVMCSDATEEDWRELERSSIYTDEDLRRFEEFGSYIGYRLGIRSDGDWMSFVAGD